MGELFPDIRLKLCLFDLEMWSQTHSSVLANKTKCEQSEYIFFNTETLFFVYIGLSIIQFHLAFVFLLEHKTLMNCLHPRLSWTISCFLLLEFLLCAPPPGVFGSSSALFILWLPSQCLFGYCWLFHFLLNSCASIVWLSICIEKKNVGGWKKLSALWKQELEDDDIFG